MACQKNLTARLSNGRLRGLPRVRFQSMVRIRVLWGDLGDGLVVNEAGLEKAPSLAMDRSTGSIGFPI